MLWSAGQLHDKRNTDQLRQLVLDAAQRIADIALAGIGAKIGLGCTSGQALTGGALLNAGSWMFMLMVFVGGYAVAWFMRWQWR